MAGLGAGAYHYLSRIIAWNGAACWRIKRPETWRSRYPGFILLGLSSIHWREAWKYGERAFRYCQHDIGHAIASGDMRPPRWVGQPRC